MCPAAAVCEQEWQFRKVCLSSVKAAVTPYFSPTFPLAVFFLGGEVKMGGKKTFKKFTPSLGLSIHKCLSSGPQVSSSWEGGYFDEVIHQEISE